MKIMASVYRIKHIGINHQDSETAMAAAEKLCAIFDLSLEKETGTRVFVGELFELKKNCARGKYGHVAMQTKDVETAIEHLAKKGVGILEDTIRRDKEGKIVFVFLDLEISGFAFHLTV